MGKFILLVIWFFSAKWIFGALGPHDIQLSLRLVFSGFVPFFFIIAWGFTGSPTGNAYRGNNTYYGNRADYYEED